MKNVMWGVVSFQILIRQRIALKILEADVKWIEEAAPEAFVTTPM